MTTRTILILSYRIHFESAIERIFASRFAAALFIGVWCGFDKCSL